MSHIYKKLTTDQITQLEAQAGNEAAKLIDDLLDKSVDPDLIASAVNDWLDDHPEATTTVEDGSITKAKLDSNLQDTVDEVDVLKSALTNVENLTPVNILDGVQWENGTFNASTGEEVDSTTRLRSKGYIDISNLSVFSFTITSGYKYVIYCYDASKAFVSAQSRITWITSGMSEFKLTYPVKYVRFLVADTNDGMVSQSYAEQFTAVGLSSIVNVISDLTPNVNNVSYIDLGWAIGSFDDTNGKEVVSTTRVRSTFIRAGKGTTLLLKDNVTYKYLIYTFTLNKTFVRAGGWLTNSISIEEDCYIRILVAYSNNATITDETANTVASQLILLYSIPFSDFFDDGSAIYNIPENVHKKEEIVTFKQRKSNSEAWNECNLKMMFFTDVHGDAIRTKRMKELINAWGTGFFDIAICGGDIVETKETEDVSWYYNALDGLAVPFLNTIGNHDAWTDLGGSLANKTDVYNKFIAPIVSSSGITQPEGASANGYNYYYKDIGSLLRIIVLDCMYWDATQLSWFTSVLSDAKTNGRSVIGISHAAFPLANMEKVDCLWSKSGLNTDSTRTNIEAASAVKNFMDAGGTFIAWIVGHQHGDYVHKLPDYGNQFVVNLSSFAQRAGWLLKNTDSTAYNYDCLTYIAVDTTYKKIKFMRIGADIDVFGTRYNGLVIDYDAKEVVSSW